MVGPLRRAYRGWARLIAGLIRPMLVLWWISWTIEFALRWARGQAVPWILVAVLVLAGGATSAFFLYVRRLIIKISEGI